MLALGLLHVSLHDLVIVGVLRQRRALCRYNKASHRAQHLAAAQPVIQKRIGGGKKGGGKAAKLADDSDREGGDDGEDDDAGPGDDDGADDLDM